MSADDAHAAGGRVARRALLGGSAGVLGLAVGAAGAVGLGASDRASGELSPVDASRLRPASATVAGRSLPMGLDARVPAFGTVLAIDLADEARRSSRRARAAAAALLRRMAELADAAGDTRAPVSEDRAATGAAAYDLLPASAQVTPGLSARLLDACGLSHRRPDALVDLPGFATDRLDPALCGGDLMVQLGAEDPMRLAGLVQEVVTHVEHASGGDLRVRWSRSGFRSTAAAEQTPSATTRNVMGHRDGTDNPPLGTPLWRLSVVADGPDWMAGGSYLVARRIEIDLESWFGTPPDARDRVIGRRTTTGAPLGERHEHDPVVLTATGPSGEPAIPAHAHIRLANPANVDGARIYRRSWNFDDGYRDGRRQAGLLFLAWQADVRRGFLPIQQALVQHGDALNRFTTHVGSAVFAVPARGGDAYVGQRLLED